MNEVITGSRSKPFVLFMGTTISLLVLVHLLNLWGNHAGC